MRKSGKITDCMAEVYNPMGMNKPGERPPLSEKVAERVAEAAHGLNRAYCFAYGMDAGSAWKNTLSPEKESVIDGVKYIYENDVWDPRLSHDRWMELKLRDGWKWGEIKSWEHRTHPCLLPWHGLPRQQRIKDILFLGVVQTLLFYHELCNE